MVTRKKIPLAIVGLNFGRWIIEDRNKAGGAGEYFELAAVCDLDARKAHDMASKLGVFAFTSLDQLLDDPRIPAIGLYTPPVGRADLIRKVIRSGRDVMTTKPFERDAEQALQVLEEARSIGRVVHLNSPSPLLPEDLQKIEQWRKTYDLGRAIGARAEASASYREQADGGWYDDPERCPVAPIFRFGIYLINDLVNLFGQAESVQVQTSRIFTQRPTPDNAQAGILFKNGAIAGVFASSCIDDGQHYSNALTLNFENGTIYRNVGRLAFGNGPETPTRLKLVARYKGEIVVDTAEYSSGSGEYQWEAFYRAICGEKIETPSSIVVEGLNIIAAMARAEKSGACEKVV